MSPNFRTENEVAEQAAREGFAPSDSPREDISSNLAVTIKSSLGTESEVQDKSFTWEQRRARTETRTKSGNSTDQRKQAAKDRRFGRGFSRLKKKNSSVDDEIDPYDSDPGESYRQHCFRVKGDWSKSCMAVPGFFSRRNSRVSVNRSDTPEDETVVTSPPSPLNSEMGDLYGQTPSSLPASATLVRYSLRSSITDGSERQPCGPSVMERRELRPNTAQLNISHWSDYGARPYMEDRYVVENMDPVQVEVSKIAMKAESEDVEVTVGAKRTHCITMPLTFCGIFDGHGGDKASQFCADWMSSYIRNDPNYPHDLGYAMKNAFTSADKDFVGMGQTDGTTACVVSIVGGRRVVCANAGDSRAIVVRRDGSIVRLSRDHKPGIPDETRRISALGGRVIYWGRWRVEGLLAVSRSIGDASLKPFITAEPEICEYDVGKDDWFLILASDGVWDVMDNEEAAHVVIASSCAMESGRLLIDTDRFKLAARNLAEHARSCGSADNFSVIVVDLKSCGNPKATEGRYEPL